MATNKQLFGIERVLPSTDERNWGSQVQSTLDDLIDFADACGTLISGAGVLCLPNAETAIEDGGTLTPTTSLHFVEGDGEPATLDLSEAIADGVKVGQVLVLIGREDTNTVTVPDASNTALNGNCELASGNALGLVWDGENWTELFRNT